MNNLFLLVAATFVFFLASCSSTKKASYYSTQKAIENGSLNFGPGLRIDEYINAFDQPNLKKPTGANPVSLSVDYFLKSQPFEKSTTLAQVAIRTRDLTKPEKDQKQALCIVLDISGSMSGQKLEDSKKALTEAVKELKTGTEFTLVLFDDRAVVEIPKTQISSMNRTSLAEKILKIRSGGGTNVEDGLIVGYKELANFDSKAMSRLLLITDGRSNVGVTEPKALAKEAAVKYQQHAKISTIGIGSGVDDELLRKIASQGKGHYYFSDKADTMTQLLREDLKSLTFPVAKDVELNIKAKPGFEIQSIYGFDDYVTKDSAKIPFSELNVDDWRILIVEITSKKTSTFTSPLEAILNFKTMNGKSNLLKMAPKVRWRYKKSTEEINPTVARNSVLLSNAIALKRISELASQRSYSEALNVADVQIANIEQSKKWDNSKMFTNERTNFLKIKGALEQKAGRKGLELKQDNEHTDQNKNLVSTALEIVKETVPGPWSLIIGLFQTLLKGQ